VHLPILTARNRRPGRSVIILTGAALAPHGEGVALDAERAGLGLRARRLFSRGRVSGGMVRWVCGALTLAMASLVWLPSSPAGAAGSPVITRAQAVQVVNNWAVTSGASTVAANNTVEGPPLADADDPGIQSNPTNTPGTPPSNVSVYLPNQTSYPAQFLAQATFANGQSNYLVFVKRSKSAPWLAVYQATAATSMLVSPIAVGRNGSATVVTGSSGLKFDPAALRRSVPGYGQQAALTTSAPSSKIFDPSVAQIAIGLANQVAARGLILSQTKDAPTTYPVFSYRLSDGGALVFVTVHGVGHIVSSDPTKGVALPAPGLTANTHYKSVDLTALVLIAMVVPPAKSPGLVSLAGQYLVVISGKGVPCATATTC
jgi:hypothetical protein